MKTYSPAPNVDSCIATIQDDHHAELEGVTVSALFVFDTEATSCVLKHQGYPAQAVVRITPLRERALGVADATIIVDRSNWLTLSQRQRNALIDHELTHLTRALDKDTQQPVFDVLDRPKLTSRRHDHQFGWFDEIAQRHGDASPEIRQAKHLVEASGQLYFEFGRRVAQVARAQDDPDMLVWWHNGRTGEAWSGKRSEMPLGCVEIDPPVGSKSDAAQTAALTPGETPVPGTMPNVPLPPLDDSAESEVGVANELSARGKRASNITDGLGRGA
jgi:hypothetical protein